MTISPLTETVAPNPFFGCSDEELRSYPIATLCQLARCLEQDGSLRDVDRIWLMKLMDEKSVITSEDQIALVGFVSSTLTKLNVDTTTIFRGPLSRLLNKANEYAVDADAALREWINEHSPVQN